MIMSLCNKSVHSFLGLTNTTTTTPHTDDDDNKNGGLGLAPAPAPAVPPFTFPYVFSKKDHPAGGIGFIDGMMGGGVDGLMSCTESLGFESSDERIDHHQVVDEIIMDATRTSLQNNESNQASSDNFKTMRRRKDKESHHHQEVKKFPPPLSSFNRNGQPSVFLRSVRTDGRLELTEVRVDRPEILRASREDGRLRLHLIREDEDEEEEEEDILEGEEETLEEEDDDEEEEEDRVGEWKLEGYRRCKEMNHGHHHHHHHHHGQHVWSQQCVPTR